MDKIYLFGFYFLKFFVNFTPKFIQNLLINLLIFCYKKINKERLNVVKTNLNLAFKNSLNDQKKEQIIDEVYKNFANYLGINFIKNQNAKKDEILNQVIFKNEKILINAQKTDRPIIIITAHFGDWELLSLAIGAKFGGIAIVGRKLDSKKMDRILSKNRKQFDITLIDKIGGAKKILSCLKNKKILGILVDQNTSKSDGIEVKFFDKKVLHTPSASIFAQKTNALIIPTFIKKFGDKNEIIFFDPIDINKFPKNLAILEATQAQAKICEKMIKKNPAEYFWFHKRFKHFYKSKYEN